MKKIQRYIKLVFVMLLTVTSFGIQLDANVLAEEGLGNEDIRITLDQSYNEEINAEDIKFGVQAKAEGTTVLEVSDSEDNILQSDENIYSHVANANGNHEYTVKYQLASREVKEYQFTVDVDSIKATKQELTIQPLIDVSNGKVRVEIEDYDADAGWTAGDIKVVTVYAEFEATDTEKKLDISLPMGMKYEKYRVLNPKDSLEMEVEGVLKEAITKATSPNQKVGSSRYGTLSYEFGAGTESVKIELSIAVDPITVSKNTTITDGIIVKAQQAGIEIGNVKEDIVAKREAVKAHFHGVINEVAVLKDDDNISVPSYTFFAPASAFYFSELEVTYYYPANFKYVSITGAGTYNSIDVNEVAGTITLRYEDRYITSIGASITVSGVGVDVGKYTVSSIPQMVAYDFQGEAITQNVTSYPNLKPIINVKESYDNKLSIGGNDGYFYDAQEDYYSTGPLFLLVNDAISDKTDQIFEVKIDSNYLVSQVNVPYEGKHNTNGIKVYYKTNKKNNTWMLANENAVTNKKINPVLYHAQITKASLQLDDDEYITNVKGYIGTVSKGFRTSPATSTWTIPRTEVAIGRLKDGVNNATVQVDTYAETAGTVDADSISTVTKRVIRDNTGSTTIGRHMYETVLLAGDSTTQRMLFGYDSYRYGRHFLLNSPVIYLRVPEGITYSNFKIKSLMNGVYKDVDYEVSKPYVSAESGETFIKIKVNENFGHYFGEEMLLKQLVVDFDITANIQAKTINLNWKDYAFVQDSVFSSITNANNTIYVPSAIADTLDVNNDGNTTELITPIYSETYQINSKTGLLIDTYITPDGETRQNPYDGSEESAVVFKPETEATYTIDMFNNTKEDLTEITGYIPVAKAGINFGTNFQSETYSWDMKLNGNPTISVYDVDGNDVSDSRKSSYKLEYSSNASTASNYINATYTSTYNENTTMIRLTNVGTIPNGEQVVINFPYATGESDTSVEEDMGKLGSVNDFMPYYYYKSDGSSGYANGTRVGAILSIGTIEGVVFMDNNANGIYDAGDTLINGGTVNLFSKDNVTATPDATATIQYNGTYKFTNLDIDSYTLDFSSIPGKYQKFSVSNIGKDDEELKLLDSEVTYLGKNAGKVFNINTALLSSKSVNAGIINYQPPTLTSTENLYYKKGNTQNDLFLFASAGISKTGYFTEAVELNQTAVNYDVVGKYTVNLSVSDAYGGSATHTFNVNIVDTITAKGFIIPLEDVATANFENLAGAKAYDVSNSKVLANSTIKLKGNKPTTTGLHEVTFEANTGETIKVNVLVYSETITNNEVIEANNFTVTLKALKDADMKTLAGAKGYDVSDPTNVKEIAVETLTAKPTKVGVYPIQFKTANGATKEVTAIVTGKAPTDDKKEVVIAHDFQVKLSDVETANFVTLANAKGYDVSNINDPKEVAVTLKSTKPTTVGVHKVRFETANGAFTEVEVIVSNNDPEEVEINKLEVVTAQDFTVALKDVGTADFVALAKAKGYEYPTNNVDEKTEIAVTLKSAKPTTAGTHTIRFETAKGTYAEVEVVIYDGVVTNNQVINASNFTVTLNDLKTADMKDLANVKAYDISDSNDIKEIPVITVTPKPTKVGTYEITFATLGGVTRTVTAIVSDNSPTVDKKEVVIAQDFQVTLKDVATADFVKLAEAKGYDVSNINNPTEVAVTLKSAKPTTVGVHKVRFETANGAFTEVEVVVSNNDPEEIETDKLEVVIAQDFAVALDDVADEDFVTLAKAKGYEYPKNNVNDKIEIAVKMIGKKPRTEGTHTIRFETEKGAYAEVNAVVYSGTVVNGEIINASNFAVTLNDLKTADMKNLANAKAYDISDPNNIKEIAVITESAKPTKVGKYEITFKTAGGASKTVTAIVSDQAPTDDKNEVVIAEGFEIAVSDIASADFVKLAKAKGYDVTDINNPKDVAVTLKSKKPTTIGTHEIRFETANRAYAEVSVKVYTNSGGGEQGEEEIFANDFSYGISEGTLSEAKAKELASVSAYKDDGSKLDSNQVSVSSKQLKAINDAIGAKEKGTYDLAFTTPKGINVTISVTLYDTGSGKDEEYVYGNNFTYRITQGEITEAKAKELASVSARTSSGAVIDLDDVSVKKAELDAINKAITNKSIADNPYKLTFITASGSSVVIDVTLQQGKIKIVDDFRDDDGIVVIYRTGDTGEKAPTYLPNGYSPTYDLKLQVGGEDMSKEELAKVTWTIEEAGGFSSILTYIETTDGSATITAKKSGVVKLVANYEGVTDSIYVVIPGDLDRNGIVNALDAGRIQNYARSKKKSDLGKDDEFTFFLADMNGDGLYNPLDAGIIQNMAKKILKPSN